MRILEVQEVIENFNSLQAALKARIKKKQTFFNSSANQVRKMKSEIGLINIQIPILKMM